jgi:hypothetical protein
MEAIKTIPLGEPAIAPLSDFRLSEIATGMLLPSQAASKSMARELLRLKGLDDYGNPLKG